MSGTAADSINEAGDDFARDVANQSSHDREQRWQAETEDRTNLRGNLEKWADEEFTKPKEKPSEDDIGTTPREAAEKAWDQTHFAAEERERDKKEVEKLKQLAGRIKREHGIDGVDGLERLVAAEAVMRQASSPQEVLQMLQQAGMLDGTYHREVQATTHQSAVEACEAFMTRYDIPPAAEKLMMTALNKGDVARTGNFDRDLMTAYRHVMKGADRVVAR